MKFRNKATKEIRKAEMRDDGIYLFSETAEEWRRCDWEVLAKYWEEYREEPKEYWFVSCDGRALKATTDEDDYNEKHNTGHKEIGNYFETKEEAEKAAEKLRAYKRLKDKGFRFEGKSKPNYGRECIIRCSLPKETLVVDVAEDLGILFGGGE